MWSSQSSTNWTSRTTTAKGTLVEVINLPDFVACFQRIAAHCQCAGIVLHHVSPKQALTQWASEGEPPPPQINDIYNSMELKIQVMNILSMIIAVDSHSLGLRLTPKLPISHHAPKSSNLTPNAFNL